MKRKYFAAMAAVFVAICCLAFPLGAQVTPAVAKAVGPLPDGWRCTAEVLNKSSFAVSGGVEIPNVATNQGDLRLQATCVDGNGNTLIGKTDELPPVPGGRTIFADFNFTTPVLTPTNLQVLPQSPQFTLVGQTIQLTVSALINNVPTNVTTSPNTRYSTSNDAVVEINGAGLMTAIGVGRAIVMAYYEGKIGMTVVEVFGATLTAIEATPSSVVLAPHSLFAAPSAQLRVEGLLNNGGRLDLTPGSSGTLYSSSQTGVATVTAEGLIVARNTAGSATITINNGIRSDTVAVETRPTFVPSTGGQMNSPGGVSFNVEIVGSYLYVADESNGVVIYQRGTGYVGRFAFDIPARDVHSRGRLLAVGLSNAGPGVLSPGTIGGISLLDITDSSRPRELSRIRDTGPCVDVWIGGDQLFAAAGGNLKVYDISDPANPVLRGTMAFAQPVLAVSGDGTRNLALALFRYNLAVVQAAGNQPWSTKLVGLPTAPQPFGQIEDDVYLYETTAYVANHGHGIHAVDVADPENPRRTINGLPTATFSRGVAIRETPRGLLIASADTRTVNATPLFDHNLTLLMAISHPGDEDSHGVALGDGFGAVANGGAGIRLFNYDDLTDNRGVAPTVSISNPVHQSTLDVNRDFAFEVIAVDDVQVDRVELKVNGTLVATDSRPPFETTLNLAAGAYTLRAEAIDRGNNRGISQSVNITVAAPPDPPIPGAVLAGFKGTIAGAGLDTTDRFGSAVASLGDLDGAGGSAAAVAVGAPNDDDGGSNRGAVWIVFLSPAGVPTSQQKISDLAGGFSGVLDNADNFGNSVASIGDLDADGIPDLAVGAVGDDDGALGAGAVWILFLNSDGTVKGHNKVSATSGLVGQLSLSDGFGSAVASLGFHGGGQRRAILAGAPFDDDVNVDSGSAFVVYLNPDGTVFSHQKISGASGGFGGTVATDDAFGQALAALGDLDEDGVDDVLIGAPGDSQNGTFRGAFWVVFLNADGTVKGQQKVNGSQGGFGGTLDDVDNFGRSLAPLGDIDDDGLMDIAVGAPLDDDGGADRGAVWVLFLNGNGTVKGHTKLSSAALGMPGVLVDGDQFGYSVSSLGDLDGDGKSDVAVGARGDDGVALDAGAVWYLMLDGYPQ